MTNSANGIQREIKVKGQKFGMVTRFKYLGAIVSGEGSKWEVLSRIAQASAALTKQKPIWRDNNISLESKVKLMRFIVISVFVYTCESWTLTAELEKKTQAFEMRCYHRLLNISYKDHIISEDICRKIQATIGNSQTPDLGQVVWAHVKVFWLSKDSSTGHSERKKKKR